MFKALLCDDNEIILEGLASGIDWENLGIRLAGTARDGEAALRLVGEVEPDILITDIRMPLRDGLALAEAATELNPDMAVVVISGYNEFEYARRAVQLGAMDYVLKPIEPEELKRVLQKVVDRCAENLKTRQKRLADLLRGLMYREAEPEAALQNVAELGIDAEMDCCVVQLRLDTRGFAGLPESTQYEIERRLARFANEIQRPGVQLLEKNKERYLFALYAAGRTETLGLYTHLVRSARKKVFSSTAQVHLAIARGNIGRGLATLAASLAQSEEAMALRFIMGAGATITYEDVQTYQKAVGEQSPPSPREVDLLAPLWALDKAALDNSLEKFREHLRAQGGESQLYMTLMVGNLYSGILRELDESGIDSSAIFAEPMLTFKEIVSAATLDETIQRLGESLGRIMEYLELRQGKHSATIEAAKRYIRVHYKNPGLSIEDVAGAVFLSAGHFSAIFKAETGSTFTDYLIGFRMEKAKELLEKSAEKVYKISLEVGYDSAAYFSSAFKKYTGLSPSEYKVRQNLPPAPESAEKKGE